VVPFCGLLSPHEEILKKGSGKQRMLVSVSYGGVRECDDLNFHNFVSKETNIEHELL
jgi:hypothetical protein